MSNFNHTARRKAAYKKGYEAGKADALAKQPSLQDAAKELIASASDTYKKRNGHTGSFEDESGEKCWIVPFDTFETLRSALSASMEEVVDPTSDLYLKMARTQALDDAAKLASGMMLDLGHAYAYRHSPSAIRDLSDKPSGTASFFQDVVNLVIAAREFWDSNNDLSDESAALDKALEAFADQVPYENQPDDAVDHAQEKSQ